MTTVGSLLDRAKRSLLSGVVEERNKLSSAVVSTEQTSMVMTYELSGFRPGAVFELGSELIYIWSATSGTKTLEVERGYMGTIPTTHSAGAIATLSPRFPVAQMFDAFNQDVDDLSSPVHGLFRVVSVDLTYNGSDRQIDIVGSTTIIDLIDVRLRYLNDDYPLIRGVRLQRELPTSNFSSGNALVFDEGTMAGTLRVRYKAPFVRAASLSQDIQSVCLIPSSMEDILEMGVQYRMLSLREVKRNFIESQGDTRRSDEVPPGAMRDAFANLLRMRRDRITSEAARLVRQYPVNFRA